MTDAEQWIDDFRHGLRSNPGVKELVFPDGTRCIYGTRGWEIGATFKKTNEVNAAEAALGRKDDSTKPRWSLLPLHTIAQVIRVLEFGANKYSVGNWAHVPEARTRYYDATMRHIEAWWLGEKVDPESGLPHLAHAVACLLFLMWFDGANERAVKDDEAAQELAKVMKRRGV